MPQKEGGKGSKTAAIEDELLNRQTLSQFGRALEELGVHLIHAQSAPAKGRTEWLFKTFQDRLVKEMRLNDLKCGCVTGRYSSGLRKFGSPVNRGRISLRLWIIPGGCFVWPVHIKHKLAKRSLPTLFKNPKTGHFNLAKNRTFLNC